MNSPRVLFSEKLPPVATVKAADLSEKDRMGTPSSALFNDTVNTSDYLFTYLKTRLFCEH
jgi:hypothetical protein